MIMKALTLAMYAVVVAGMGVAATAFGMSIYVALFGQVCWSC